jgi:AcrR family transcriptional regulator
MSAASTLPRGRLSQGDRRARSRTALLEAAARGLSRYGYGNLVLDQVASDAGYTRGALYHQFRDKQELTTAVLDWVDLTWDAEVLPLVKRESEPVDALFALARGHALYCRRDFAQLAVALRLEFAGQDHPVGRRIEAAYQAVVERCVRLVREGRRRGTIPAGPPARTVALALVGAVEGASIAVAGRAPHDVQLAVGVAAGILGVQPSAPDAGRGSHG